MFIRITFQLELSTQLNMMKHKCLRNSFFGRMPSHEGRPLIVFLFLALGLLGAPLVQAQDAGDQNAKAQPPDPLTVRNAINNSCLTTPGTKDQVWAVEEIEIPVEDRKLTARLYRPKMAKSSRSCPRQPGARLCRLGPGRVR